MVSLGTYHTRTHVDVDPAIGLTAIHAVRDAASRLGDQLEVEIVAFPQAGLLTRPGTYDLLDQALGEGADYIGGIDPAGYDGDAVAHLDAIFGLAQKHGAPLDIHLHDMGNLGVWELELILQRTKTLGLSERVTVSHAFVLTDESVPAATRGQLIGRIAALGVSLACSSVKKPLPLRELAATGNRSIDAGGKATLVAVEARTVAEAIVMHPDRRLVMIDGARA
jgi:cytosine deaminase